MKKKIPKNMKVAEKHVKRLLNVNSAQLSEMEDRQLFLKTWKAAALKNCEELHILGPYYKLENGECLMIDDSDDVIPSPLRDVTKEMFAGGAGPSEITVKAIIYLVAKNDKEVYFQSHLFDKGVKVRIRKPENSLKYYLTTLPQISMN